MACVEVLDSLQGGTELADEGLHEQRIGGDDALIGGQGDGRLDGVDALGNNVRRAHMVLAKEGLQGRAAGQLCGLQGGPAAEKVTKHDGVFVLKPLERLREIIFQGAREPIGDPHFVPHHAPAVFDELCQGTHGGALWVEGRQLVAVGAQQFELQCGVRGVILRAAGGKRFAVPGEGQGVERERARGSGICARQRRWGLC